MNFVPLGACGGTAPFTVNVGPPLISETITARNLEFYTHVDRSSALSGNGIISAKACEGRSAFSINLGPLISRKLLELES